MTLINSWKNTKNNIDLRQELLEELAEAIVLQTSPGLAHESLIAIKSARTRKQIKQLIHRERKRGMYRNLGRILKPQTSIGLSKVDIPDPEANQPSFGTHSQPKS